MNCFIWLTQTPFINGLSMWLFLTYFFSWLTKLTEISAQFYIFVKDFCFFCFLFFFSIRVFFHGHWQLTGQQGKGGDHLLFHSTTSIPSQTFRHLFATLQVRWLSHIFNHNTCIYQTATWWDLPPYQITIWLIDDVMLI